MYMSKRELIKRYLVFAISVMLCGFAIGSVAKADLGTTPISSSNYVLSLHTPLTLGLATFIFNIILTVALWFMLNRGERRQRFYQVLLILQIPISVVFSFAIDLGMYAWDRILPAHMTYFYSLLLLIFGCVLQAFAIALQITANAAMVTGEAFVKILSQKIHKEFGYVKMGFDISLVILAVFFSFLFNDPFKLDGVREGTVLGALSVGPMVKFMMPKLGAVRQWFVKGEPQLQPEAAAASEGQAEPLKMHKVITIAREYGCGGRVIGRLLAGKLGINFYDTNLIEMIAKEAGISTSEVEKAETPRDAGAIHEIIMRDYLENIDESLSAQDALYVACSRAIRKLALKESCVIVGRNADDILSDNPLCLNIYLYGSTEHKLKFCREHYKQKEDEALNNMKSFDKMRADHYAHYTGRNIADPKNYLLSLDAGTLGVEKTVEILAQLYQKA